MSHWNACSAIHPKTTAWTPGKEDCSHKNCGSHDFRLWSPQSYSFCKYQAFVQKKKFHLPIQNNTNRCHVALLTQSSRKLTSAEKVDVDPSSDFHPSDEWIGPV